MDFQKIAAGKLASTVDVTGAISQMVQVAGKLPN